MVSFEFMSTLNTRAVAVRFGIPGTGYAYSVMCYVFFQLKYKYLL